MLNITNQAIEIQCTLPIRLSRKKGAKKKEEEEEEEEEERKVKIIMSSVPKAMETLAQSVRRTENLKAI